MKDLGDASGLLGIDIRRDRKQSRLCLSQNIYLKKIIDKFGMLNSKSMVTPNNPNFKLSSIQSPSTEVERAYMNSIMYASIISYLMYVMVCTRSDIAYGVSFCKQVYGLRYINGSLNIVLIYGGSLGDDSKVEIRGFVDSDYA